MTHDFTLDVLIVEDDTLQAEALAAFLRESGLGVELAVDGLSAITLATQYRPRVVLVDYSLPDVTGLELAEQLRAMHPRSAILVMSGWLAGVAERNLDDLAISAFVDKPVQLRPLGHALLDLVQRPSAVYAMEGQPVDWLSTAIGGPH